jgi:hypothetical protein
MSSIQPRPAECSESAVSAVSAVDKKRERKREIDRISQHRKRQKDRERIVQLEEQLNCLRRPHDNSLMASLLDTQKKQNLRAARHRERLKQIEALLKADVEDFKDEPTKGTAKEGCDNYSEVSNFDQNYVSGPPSTDPEIQSPDFLDMGTSIWPDFSSQNSGTTRIEGPPPEIYEFPKFASCGNAFLATSPSTGLDLGTNLFLNSLGMNSNTASCFPGDMKCPRCYAPWQPVNDLIQKARIQNQQSIGSRVAREEIDVHVMVLAVTQGWSAVIDRFQLDAHLQCLRCFDERLFSAAGQIDRLSVLWAVHRMLKVLTGSIQSCSTSLIYCSTTTFPFLRV